ncbi:hypothetical protein [Methylophilus sp. DW102]|uniref:hypothetical protein n=1 Tax=Methylophilus sp. DW102 TaxID=3095607 RepID=UPI003084A6E6|nr:hypothetical protein MTDW_13070 [Methylophilus sp. DW102]BEV09347.1 hypothetical protein MTDW_26470 [Methylophilus sp. DW102]
MPPVEDDLRRIAEGFGELKGELRSQHQATMRAFDNIRDDMQRMEDSQKQAMQSMEERLNGKIDSLGGRVRTLEQKSEDAKVAAAKQGVAVSGITAALTYAAIEIIKRIPH